MFPLPFYDVDAFYCSVYGYNSINDVYIVPFQSTDFTDPKTCTETDIDAKSWKGEVALYIFQDFL